MLALSFVLSFCILLFERADGERGELGTACTFLDVDSCSKAWKTTCDLRSRKCVCLLPYVQIPGTKKCDVRSAELGQSCNPPQCNPANPDIECINNRCTCRSPKVQAENNCVLPVPVGLREACSQARPCVTSPGIICDNVCRCKDGYEINSVGNDCDLKAYLGDACGGKEPSCATTLECVAGICKCLPDLVPASAKICGPPAKLDETCGGPYKQCATRLNCVAGKCKCNSGLVPISTTDCGPPAKVNEKCHTVEPKCGLNSTWNLECDPTSKCVCTKEHLVHGQGYCIPYSFLSQKCEAPYQFCATSLECVAEICKCLPDLVPASATHCGPPAKLDEKCGGPYQQCATRLNCVAAKCKCVSGLVPISKTDCGPPAKVNEVCHSVEPRCGVDLTWNLECDPASKCVCAKGHIAHGQGHCILYSLLGQKCDGPYQSCDTSLNCVKGVCKCNQDMVPISTTHCGPPAKLNEKCHSVEPKCGFNSTWNLKCDPTLKCVCTDGHVPHGQGYCIPESGLNERCDKPYQKCGNYLECVAGTCKCLADAVPISKTQCGPPAKLNEKCHTVEPKCGMDSTWNLECSSTSVCICTKGNVAHSERQCGLPSKLGEICEPFPACLSKSFLTCAKSTTKKCECEPENFPKPDKTCGPPALYGQVCHPVYPQCKPNVNLACTPPPPGQDGAANSPNVTICTCTGLTEPTSLFGVQQTGGCELPPPSLLEEKCEIRAFECRKNVSLKCQHNVCKCVERWMNHDITTGGCKYRPKSALYQFCQLDEDCIPGFKLVCDTANRQCKCEFWHEPEPEPTLISKKCTRKPSKYDEPCEKDYHCLEGHFMRCVDLGKRNVCQCQDNHDLNQGRTPCQLVKSSGRTYGETCDESPPILRCVKSHNLECSKKNLCVCLPDFVVDETTKEVKEIGVSTCKLGTGTKKRGEDCIPTSNNPGERCDTLQGLDCEDHEKLCVCANGYLPVTQPNGSTICTPGSRVYGESCDPSERIIRKMPIDPRTGLEYPGEKSPPPPNFACNGTKFLACVNGKCICVDELFAGRFRFDPKSKRCLIMPTYACEQGEDCMSGRCLTKAQVAKEEDPNHSVPGHDHGEMVCASLPREKMSQARKVDGGLLYLKLGCFVLIFILSA